MNYKKMRRPKTGGAFFYIILASIKCNNILPEINTKFMVVEEV